MGWSYQGPPARLGLLILLVTLTADARECKINCHGSSGNILRFEPGKVYNYKLEGNSKTLAAGSTGEASKLGISADVQVAVLSSCEHVLKVTNVQTTGQDSKKHSLNKLSQQPIKFGLQNGQINSELCANDAEDNVALNIKRAVLSLIQSSVLKESGYGTQSETDVFGTCPTGFEFSKSGSTITIVKNRDLNKCSHREDFTFPFLATPYYVKSDIQTSPLLASSLRSEQKIDGGILKSGYLEEQYQYRPGGYPEAVSSVSIETRLSFVNAAPGAIPAACTAPRSIIFEQEHLQEVKGFSNKIVELVKQGCENRIIGQDTAFKFAQLVRSVSTASKEDINAALHHVKSGPGIKDRSSAQRMLLDAILMARSGSSVEVIADLLKKKEVPSETAELWLVGLGAVKHATRSSLLSVLPLLDGEPSVNAYLGIGSLAGKHCRKHNCDGVNEVNQLQIKLGAPLLKGCKVGTKKEEDQIIASLKGLGNVRYLSPKISGKIIECAQDESVRTRIRVAALETITSDPNKDQFKNLALSILKNVAEDSELRIKAYLILAKCPCGKIAGAIRELLHNEKSNQVGGYIVSHLRNLHASTNPDKEAARHYLGNIIPPRRFVIDPRRYSINQELSYSNGIINSGASGEVDLIYSQNSYLPRSVNLNLTSQIFGTAYNFLELDIRSENLELIAEKIFGPRGVVNTEDPTEVFQEGRHRFSQLLEKIAHRYDKVLRPKRSLRNDIAKKVHLPPSSNDVNLDLSLKVLGSEVSWTHLHGSDAERFDEERIVDGSFGRIDKLIEAMKNSEMDYRRHFTFIDREVTYPTGMGLALRLRALGNAAIRLKVDGKLDIPAIIKDPKNSDIRFQIIPSAAINLGGEIVIDGVDIETGLRMDLNIHSSTGSDVTFRVLDGHGVDVKIGLPLPKQEVVSVKTEYHSISRGDDQVLSASPVKYETPRETYSGCFDQLSTIIGLTFCGEISVPFEQGKPILPLHGPVNMAVSIDKDETLSSYHFKAYYVKSEENVHSFELLLDTPNSSPSRKFSINLEGSIRDPKRYISIALDSPWTTASLNAHLVSSDKENSINVKFIDNDQEYTARIGSRVTESGGGKVKYEPILEYKAPEGSKSALIGKKGGQKPKSQAILTSGSVLVEHLSPTSHRYTFQSLGITTPRTKYSIDGTLTIETDAVSGDVKISYDKENIAIKGKAHQNKKGISASLDVAPTQYPDLGISGHFEIDTSSEGKYDQKLILVHGPDPKSQVSRIFMHNSYERVPGSKFALLHKLSYPVVKLDVYAKLSLSQNEVSAGLKGKLDKYSAKLEGGFLRNGKNEGDYQLSVDAELMGQELNLQSSRSVEGSDKSRFTNLLILKPGGTYQLNALVNHRVAENDVDLSIEADGSIPNKSAIKLSGSLKHGKSQSQSNVKFYLGDKCFIDGSAVFSRGSSPSGNFKLALPGYLESDGKLSSDNSRSSVVAQLYLPKADRRMDAKADFSIKGSKYSGTISACYDTKDPKKTFKLQTDNDVLLKEGLWNVETKNSLSHGNTGVQINGKLNAKGKVANAISSGEAEVILPNGYRVGGKYNEKYNFEDSHDAEGSLELWDQPRGEELQKLQLRFVGKHINLKAGTIDGQGSISYTARDKRNIHAHVNGKKLPSSDGKSSNVALEVGSSGSLTDLPVAFKLESDISNEYFDLDESLSLEDDLPPLSFKFSGSAGQDIKLDGTGKIGQPSTLELSGSLPQSSNVKNFKLSSSALIDLDDDKENIKISSSLDWNGNRHVKALLEGKREEKGAQFAVEYETDSIPKRRLSGSAHLSQDGDIVKGDASVALTSNSEVADLSIKGDVNKEKAESNIHILANAPQVIEGGKLDIVIKQKYLGNGAQSEIVISKGSQKLIGTAKFDLDQDHPVIEINLDNPDKPQDKSRFFFKADKKGERHYSSELNVKWAAKGGGSLSAEQEVNLESMDNFLIKNSIDSPQLLEHKSIYVEVANRPVKGEAKKISFLLKAGDKVVASGSSSYNYKEEGDVAVLEGNGNIKLDDQSYPLSFQATRQLLENGRVAKLAAKAGKMSLNVEHKILPDEFSFERTFCKDQKTCSKAQISSKLKTSLEKDEQSVVVLLDLSLFNPKLHDISYKSLYKRNNLLVDHAVDLQWASDAKLSSKAFIHEKSAGLYVDFPRRTIGGEVKYDVQKKDNSASVKVESELYINKGKEPKLSLIAGTATVYDKGSFTVAGEAKVAHPSLEKDLFAKGQLSISDKASKLIEGLLEIDVSKDANNKVLGKLKVSGTKDNVLTQASLKSKGCNIDIQYEEKIKYVINGKDSSYSHIESLSYVDSKNTKRELLGKFEASYSRVFALLKSPDAQIEADFKLDKGYSGSLNIFGKKYRDSLTYNKETRVAKYQLTGLADGKSLIVEAGGKLGGVGVFRASLGDKRACSVDVNLDEANFLKSKYSYDTDTAKDIYATFTKEISLVARDGSKSISALYDRNVAEAKRLLDCARNARPNLAAAMNYLEGQLQQIREEIASDKTLQDVTDILREASGDLGKQIVVIAEEVGKLMRTVCDIAQESLDTLISIAKEIQPKLRSSIQRLSKVFSDLLENYLKLSVELLDLILDEIKEHKEDIEVFAKTFVDFIEDIGKQIGQIVIAVNRQFEDLLQHNLESMKDVPIVSAIQEKWQELKELQVPEEVFGLLHELLETVKQLLPTNEASQFVTTLESVLGKILRHEDIPNKDEVTKQLYKEFIAAVKSLLALLAQSAPQTGILKPANFKPLPLLNLLRIPSGSLRVSIINLLSAKEFLPSVQEILSGLRLSLNPLENIPPYRGKAFILGGSEIITFDGVHLSIPAPCSYILAEDYKDRNFSLVAQIANGALKSLTLSSRDHSIEVRPNSNIIIGGKEHLLPTQAGNLRAWKKPGSIGLWSDYGVLVTCSESLEACFFDVSGFYFGRVRGLLGNLNGEQYDERIIPEGKIVDETGDLANAWKLDGSCSVPSTADHKHVRNADCTEIFTDEPVSLFCRPFVNPAPFRDACDHLAGRSKVEGACHAARAYTLACRQHGVLIAEVPDVCATCKINGKSVEIGESVEVSQSNAADIVLLVDLAKDNERNYKDVAIPLVSNLKSELAKAGVSDTKIFLIGASPINQYPSFFSNVNGGLDHEAPLNDLPFDVRPEAESGVHLLYNLLRAELGRTSGRRMYHAISDTPNLFRPNAFRFVVGVHSKPCLPTLGNVASGIMKLIEQEEQGIQYSVISPVINVTKEGKPLPHAAVISDAEAVLQGGESVEGIDYDGIDICVMAAADSGFALSGNELSASPKRASIINQAAAVLTKNAVLIKKMLDCECSLWNGIVPEADCSIIEAW